jgi:hypothetical protein
METNTMKRLPLVVVSAVLILGGTTSVAQSLGDLARIERERRELARPGTVYKAADLHRDRATPVPSPAAPAPAVAAPARPGEAAPGTTATPAGSTSAPPTKVLGAGAEGDPRGETYWRSRARELRSLLRDTQAHVEALTGALIDLDAQLQAKYSAPLAGERTIVADALVKAHRDLRALVDALQTLEKSAKAANVPAAWIE